MGRALVVKRLKSNASRRDDAKAPRLPYPPGFGFSPRAKTKMRKKEGFKTTSQRREITPLGIIIVDTGEPSRAFACSHPSHSMHQPHRAATTLLIGQSERAEQCWSLGIVESCYTKQTVAN
jgi:hypothetical protein